MLSCVNFCSLVFLPMARPHASKRPVSVHQLSSLSSEVLRLRLQALNLSVRGSRQQLITRLKSALKSQASRAGHAMPVRPGRSSRRKERTNAASTTAQPTELNSERDSDSDGHSLSIEDGSPSLDNLLSLQDRSVPPRRLVQRHLQLICPLPMASYASYNKRCKRLCRTLASSRNTPTSLNIPCLRSTTQAWLCLSVFNGLWTALWRRKSCGVSTLILHCFYQTR